MAYAPQFPSGPDSQENEAHQNEIHENDHQPPGDQPNDDPQNDNPTTSDPRSELQLPDPLQKDVLPSLALSPSPAGVLSSAPVPAPAPALSASSTALPQFASYEALRQRIAAQEFRRRSLFLASVGSGEGTTTTALHLARSLARETPSVLLAELRFSAPHLRYRLGAPAGASGLEEGLRGTVQLDTCLSTDTETPLSLLTLKLAMPAEEAAHLSGPLNDFLEWAEAQFEWLVFDCPPITSPDWTLWFDLNADPVLLVVRSRVTRQHAVQKAARRLKDRLAGAILFQS